MKKQSLLILGLGVLSLGSKSQQLINTGFSTGDNESQYNAPVLADASETASNSILGLDVSHFNGTINWPQVAADSKVFAFVKATEGISYTDPAYTTNMVNGSNAGIVMGEYHFARPISNNAVDEANYFLNVAGVYIHTCNLPPVLDLENPSTGGTLTGSFSSAALSAWVQQWMSTVQNATGIAPLLYTNSSIASYLNSSLTNYGLWIANPDGSSTTAPANIGVWTTWAFKQYSWSGTVPGINAQTDLNVFNGDMDAFNNLTGCTTGISENKSRGDFSVYPNPATDKITIGTISSDNNQSKTLEIYTVQGQLIAQQQVQEQQTEMNVSDFAGGVYFVNIKTENGVEVKKFVKE